MVACGCVRFLTDCLRLNRTTLRHLIGLLSSDLRDCLWLQSQHVAELAKLKKVMAQQFLEEGRDKYGFVTKDGKLLGGTTYLYGKVVAEFIWNSYELHTSNPPGVACDCWGWLC